MADVTRRRTGELLRRLFQVLMPQPEGVQARNALAKLSQAVELSDYERGTYESGGRRFEKIVRFATVDCVVGVQGRVFGQGQLPGARMDNSPNLRCSKRVSCGSGQAALGRDRMVPAIRG